MLPNGNWIRVVIKTKPEARGQVQNGLAVTADSVHRWLTDRGVNIPIENIEKKTNSYTATICFTNKDVCELLRWIMGDDQIADEAGVRYDATIYPQD